jgi:two-component system chemotaxis response regulator CheB
MAAGKRIRVLVVDDSMLFRAAITRDLGQDPQIEVVGAVADAYAARDKIAELKPDVVTLDVEMPGMNGIEFLKYLMPRYPIPVIVISAANENVFEAMNNGAVDFILKPDANNAQEFARDLAAKIKIAAVARLVRHNVSEARGTAKAEAVLPPSFTQSAAQDWDTSMLVAIGASTGGTEATSRLLRALPAGLPGIVITQHMPPVFTRMYAERLNRESRLTVVEAENGMAVRPGHAYVAPGDAHLRVVKRGTGLQLKVGGNDKVNGHCPSVDVLFESVADAMGPKAVGILLTGMGADGAKGLLRMREKGAFTIGQDRASSVVYGMPMEAMKLGAVTRQASLDAMPSLLLSKVKRS